MMSLFSPRISVVMPTLNQSAFIVAAIQSVFDQGEIDLELIVADGGSTDGTQALLGRLADQFGDRLKWFSQADSGPAQAVNKAVDSAQSSLIGWLNSDDLYLPGALARALTVLEGASDVVMVYGEGEHIDAQDRVIATYPTRAANTPIADFAHGCFICQPTAFFRKDAFLALGGLDESLKAAFDFDLWLRMFKAYPSGIRNIAHIQARSRLHAAGITVRDRERVAMEGMAVVARHLGAAPAEWLLTHFEERKAIHPSDAAPQDLRADLTKLVGTATKWTSRSVERLLRDRLTQDVSLRLATPNMFVAVHPDGWAPRVLEIRLCQPAEPRAQLQLKGRHAHPHGAPLRAAIQTADGASETVTVAANGPFEWFIPLDEQRAGAHIALRIVTEDFFVPAQSEPGSTDARELAYIVESARLL